VDSMMNPTSEQCWIDAIDALHRDPIIPIYADIDCIDRKQAEAIRDSWLRIIRDGRLGDSNTRVVQMVVNDLDFLIRGGRVTND